jgi:DNA-binding winged helix-turn-helix (wHTH) protein
MPGTGRYLVGDIVVDLRSRTVRTPEVETELTPRAFDLLLTLLASPYASLHRDTLFEQVWGTTFLEDANLTQGIFIIRKALGETRKHWVRTLPKIGYRFEPPCDVVFEPEGEKPGAFEPTATATGASVATPPAVPAAAPWSRPASHIPATPRSFTTTRLAVGLLAALMLGVPGARPPAFDDATGTAASRLAATIGVMLVDAEPSESRAEADRATRLLREWVRWKLSLLPTVVLVEEEDLIDGRDIPTYVVDLSVVSSPKTGRYSALARIRPLARAGAIAGAGATPAEDLSPLAEDDHRLPTVVDAASDALVAALLPKRRIDRWPALDLEADTAMRFADAMQTLRRTPAAAVEPLQSVVEAAPEFGPARLALARAFEDAGKHHDASAHAALARSLSTPLPADAALVLMAETEALSPTRNESAAALYATLHAAYPARASFLLGQAQSLLRANQPESAIPLLSQPIWQHQPLNVRIPQLLARAETEFTLGYHRQARESATAAIDAIDSTGDVEAWPRLRAEALLLFGRAYNQQNVERRKPELNQAAADAFQRSGYPSQAAIAMYYRAAAAGDLPETERLLPALTAALRQDGDHRSELRVLRTMTTLYFDAGRHKDGRMISVRGQQLAGNVGDIPTMQLFDLDLLGDDLLTGQLEMAQRRVERLRENRLWTKYRFRVVRMENRLLSVLGRHREALAALDRKLFDSERAQRPDVAPGEAAYIACARTNTLIGLGEFRLARAQLRGCHVPGWTDIAIAASLGEGWIAYHTGDIDAARRLANDADRLLLETSTDATSTDHRIELAALLTRLREDSRAERVYADALVQASKDDYGMQLAGIDTGMAELAAAHGDWETAGRYAGRVRKRFPQRIWAFESRLELLDIARLRAVGKNTASATRARALADRATTLGDATTHAQAMALAGMATTPGSNAGDRKASIAIAWLLREDAALAKR